MGRPKSNNPKEYKISVRLTKDEYERLKVIVANENLTIAQMLRNHVMEKLESKH